MRGRPTPYAVWELTLKCNLRCIHCGSRARHARPSELSTNECLDLVRQLAEAGFEEIDLIGGEAFLKRDWAIIARAIVDHGMVCGIQTGGWGFSRELVRRIRDAGVSRVGLSIDGLEASHDRQRGRLGSWNACFRAIELFREHGIATPCNTQVNRLSLPDMPQLCDRLHEAGVEVWRLAFTTAMGNAGDNAWIMIQPAELLVAQPFLAAVFRRARAHGMSPSALPNLYYFGPLARRFHYGHGRYEGDLAGLATIGIEADGTIKADPSLPTSDYAAGNIREAPLREILARPLMTFNLTNVVDDDTAHLWGFCASCRFANECRGGDAWTAHVLFGRAGNNPICHYRAMAFARRRLRERLVQVARGDGTPFDYGRFEIVEEPLDAPWPADDHHHLTAESLPALTQSKPMRPSLTRVVAAAVSGDRLNSISTAAARSAP